MVSIALINKSSVVMATDVEKIAAACNQQIATQVAPAWGRNPWPLTVEPESTVLAPGQFPLYIFDDADQAGALGYHAEDPNGAVYGKVFAKTVLDNGGMILTTSNSVSVTCSHEALELFGDPAANRYAQGLDGQFYACELCDAVENDPGMSLNGVALSNFVLPAFFDPEASTTAKRDFLGNVKKAFGMTAGGYQIKIDTTGNISQVFGESYPTWKKPLKTHPASRFMRRLLMKHGVHA